MNLCKSVLFGNQGKYEIFDTVFVFSTEKDPNTSTVKTDSMSTRIPRMIKHGALATARFATQMHLRHFVHQMAHILAEKVLLGKTTSNVNIITDKDKFWVVAEHEEYDVSDSNWRISAILAAGPMAHVAFSIVQVAIAVLFSPLTLSGAIVVGGISLGWAAGEIAHAILRTPGDFALIASKNKTHYAMALTAVIAEVALGALAIYKLI